MPRKTYNAHVSVTEDTWRAFKARCVAAGVDLRDRLAQLVELDLAGQAGAIAASSGPLEPLERVRDEQGRTVGVKLRSDSASSSSSRTKRRAPAKRKQLPVVADAEVEREARAGARSSRRSTAKPKPAAAPAKRQRGRKSS